LGFLPIPIPPKTYIFLRRLSWDHYCIDHIPKNSTQWNIAREKGREEGRKEGREGRKKEGREEGKNMQ
jgi:predicted transposase YdaD